MYHDLVVPGSEWNLWVIKLVILGLLRCRGWMKVVLHLHRYWMPAICGISLSRTIWNAIINIYFIKAVQHINGSSYRHRLAYHHTSVHVMTGTHLMEIRTSPKRNKHNVDNTSLEKFNKLYLSVILLSFTKIYMILRYFSNSAANAK